MKALYTLILVLFSVTANAAYFKSDFPRLGGTKIGSPQDYHVPTTQAELAKLDYIVIDFFPNWGGGTTAQRAALQAIKALNPNIVIVDYVILESIYNTNTGVQFARDKLDAEQWWLYTTGVNPPKIDGGDNTSFTNLTNHVPVDTNGFRWNTWFPDRVFTDMWSNLPELDGVFTDNTFWAPRINGDWDRNGTTDSKDSPVVQADYRQGVATYYNTVRSRLNTMSPPSVGSRLVVGNIGDWGRSNATTPEYLGMADGGLLERFIGETWSNEGVDQNGVFNGWGSWSLMMDAYRKVLTQITAENKFLIFGMKGLPTDYKTFRYGFGSTLLDNGYFDFSDGSGGSLYKPRVVWFDEYDLAGTGTTSWLGTAVDAPPTAVWQNGVYRRTFANGMVLVNPRGNGSRIVTIESGYTRFAGTQDPVTNNGQAATSITLADRDAILLVGAPPPPPPAGRIGHH